MHVFLWLALIGSGHLARAQQIVFSASYDAPIPSTRPVRILRHEALADHRVRLVEPQLTCDFTQKRYSGYLDAPSPTTGDDEGRHLFFTLYESRNDPSNDPVLLLLNGGPACSTFTYNLQEVGPCLLHKNDAGAFALKYNPYSWSNNATTIMLDQPVGTGFSYADSGDRGVWSTPDAARDVHAFVKIIMQAMPHLVNSHGIHMIGESYGGRYVPLMAKHLLSAADPIPLKSISLQNGWTDPKRQYESGYYASLCTNQSAYGPILDAPSCEKMLSNLPQCLKLMQSCYDHQNNTLVCIAAEAYCERTQVDPFTKTGRNPYNVMRHGDYAEDAWIEEYLNQETVRHDLGVDHEAGKGVRKFKGCGSKTFAQFTATGDGAKPSYEEVVYTLSHQVPVLVYAGDYDLICNALGNEAWTLALDWPGKEAYNSLPLTDWFASPDAKQRAGEMRSFGNLSFATVNKAGHFAPYEQPVNSLALIQAMTLRGANVGPRSKTARPTEQADDSWPGPYKVQGHAIICSAAMGGKVIVLITGANTGIGYETVKQLLTSNKAYHIIAAGRSLEKINTAVEELKSGTPKSHSTLSTAQIDVESDESIAKAAEAVEREYGYIDVLINNAGAQFDKELQTGTMTLRQVWNRAYDINVTGTHAMTLAFAPLFLKSKEARVLFITSGLSTLEGGSAALKGDLGPFKVPAGWPKPPGPSYSAYRSSKTGMNMMVLEWKRILKEDGVKIFLISPGFLATGLGNNREALKKAGAGDPSAGGEIIVATVEGKRDADVDKIVNASGTQPCPADGPATFVGSAETLIMIRDGHSLRNKQFTRALYECSTSSLIARPKWTMSPGFRVIRHQASATILCGGIHASRPRICPTAVHEEPCETPLRVMTALQIEPAALPSVLVYRPIFSAFGVCSILDEGELRPPACQSYILDETFTITIVGRWTPNLYVDPSQVLFDRIRAFVKLKQVVRGMRPQDTFLIFGIRYELPGTTQTSWMYDDQHCCALTSSIRLLLGGFVPQASYQTIEADAALAAACRPHARSRWDGACAQDYKRPHTYPCERVSRTMRVEMDPRQHSPQASFSPCASLSSMHNFLYWLGLLCFGLLERGQQATGQVEDLLTCSSDKGQGGTARYDGALEILLIVKDKVSMKFLALLSKPVVAGDLPSVQIYSPEFTGAGSCMAPRVGEPRPVHLPSMIDTVNGLLAITARGSPSMLNYMKPDFFILHNAAKMQLELRGFSDSAMTFLARFRQYGTEQSWTDEEMKACCTVFSEMILKLGVSVQMFQWQDTLPDGIILTACFPNPAGPRNKACKPTAAFRPPARYPCLHPHRLFEMRTPPTIASS
ncbi:uncharacterized protein L969DRAFT_51213 [Mixia osmundae IAM 14324]|uniref:Carboxypeptidase n=1 Tax=Mixia osmundae (strain CBS 9802 / IAM 14324 / JCM 22182 / KY 12970) TaxID=764103 RepID=G7E7S4_MIXOS|nr:uncharacterized protein L969DRAFT_51213 [Mixia osmundae IAM 14324]KEI38485.1 hypothetical protein L969DRAFT_51213 [Mixia osmundae IAM 14324]GAA98884.1 hypothetical protein E5Q_05572 [Mixia osmundae IAM 14324]